MEDLILNKLEKMEKSENISILLAVESGSRAWGFSSPDSDYDVRFIYVRPRNEYLRLEANHDVIELPINDELDISGWDLNKALRLLYKSNPTLFEWLSSPIVYRNSDFANQLRGITDEYFSPKKSLYHYLSMAKANFREYIKNDMVKAKKYFYVLRPLLACKWIIEKKCPPPMLFSELVEHELDENMKEIVNSLLDLKINSPEIKMIPRIDALNKYLNSSIALIKEEMDKIENENINSWESLDKLFLSQLS